MILVATFMLAGGYIATQKANILYVPLILRWTSFPITFAVDQGRIDRVDGSNVGARLATAFGQWSMVPTSAGFKIESPIPLAAALLDDLSRSPGGFKTFLDSTAQPSALILATPAFVQSVVGANREIAETFIASTWKVRTGNQINRFVMVVGGGTFASDELFNEVMLHEAGHALGLDHSQGGFQRSQLQRLRPIMFPNPFPIPGGRRLTPEDEMWISVLYPNATFNISYAQVNGLVRWSTGEPLNGANVVFEAISIDESGIGADPHRYSTVSGADRTGFGEGQFRLWVRPGSYRVSIEPIDQRFVGNDNFFSGSGVGPYARSPRSLSFTTGLKDRRPIVQTVTLRIDPARQSISLDLSVPKQ